MQRRDMNYLFPSAARAAAGALLAGLIGCTGSTGPVGGDSGAPGIGGESAASGNGAGQGKGGLGSGGTGTNSGGSAGGLGNGGIGMGSGGAAGSFAGGGSGAQSTPPPIVPRVARLTHFQWQNAVQDLLRLDAPPTQVASFTPDAVIGFDTNATYLRMSSTLREDYQSAAEALALKVASDPNAIAKLMPPGAPTEPTAKAQAFIQNFGLRAHRRPLTTAEANQYLALFQKGPQLAAELDAFAAGMLIVIQTVLQSPHFVYRTELGQQNVNGRLPLSGYEVAAKLALAVTGSIPDEALLADAAAGSLDPGKASAALQTHAQRLLETARAKASALHLHTQALAVSRYEIILREVTNYPEFAPSTPASMRKSAELFLGSIYDENLGVKALLTSPSAFVDANLAKIYGLSGTFGSDFTKVDVAAQSRRGFLTQPGFLALFAGEYEPDPIHRGVFVNEQILCVEVGVPSPNLPPLPSPQPNQTNRQRIDAVTGIGTCGQNCHAAVINPLGFAFENYDALGRYRTTDNGVSVDASGMYSFDGTPQTFSNALDLVQLIAASTAAHRCYASHWLSYLYGRLTASNDAAALGELAARSKAQDISTKEMIRSLVQSESFLTRAAGM